MSESITMDEYIQYMQNGGFISPQLMPEIPLYRYRSNIEYIADEIENEHIYLSALDALNDPFDSSCAISFEEALEEKLPFSFYWEMCYFLEEYPWYKTAEELVGIDVNKTISLRAFADSVQRIAMEAGSHYPALAVCKNYLRLCRSTVSKRKSLGRVACFSESWNSIPMWSYYANSHRGICFKYDLDLLNSDQIEFRNIKKSIHKVWYSNIRFFDRGGLFSPFVKGVAWSHEQEWRLFREYGDEYLHFPCLSEIYLGINFDWEQIGRIEEAIKHTTHPIKVFVLHPDSGTYNFVKIPLRLSFK